MWEPVATEGLLDTLGKPVLSIVEAGDEFKMVMLLVGALTPDIRLACRHPLAEAGLESVSKEWIWSGRGLRRQKVQTISIVAGARLQ